MSILILIPSLINRNIVDASALRDIRDASAFESYALPKLYIKQYYSVEAAVHGRIVRVRSVENRKIRENPQARRKAEAEKPKVAK